MKVADIEARFTKAQADKEVWDSLYNACFRMTMPNRNSFYTDENIPNDWQNTALLTSAGANSADAFAARFQRVLSSDGETSVVLEQPAWIESSRDMSDLISELQKRVNDDFIPNLPKTLECGYDLVAGTAPYFKYYNKIKKEFNLIPIPIKDMCITRDFKGDIDGFYRLIECKREEVPSMYREIDENTQLGGVPTNKDNKNDMIEIHESTIYNYEDGLWHFYVIIMNELMVDRKDAYSPFGCVTWTRRPGSAYGIGVGVKAMPELNQLNALRYYSTFGLMFRSAPMWLVSQDSMLDFDRLEMKPMEMIPVPSTGRDNPSITPLQLGDDPNTQQWSQTQMEMNIKETMLNDTIPNQTNQKLTATEVAARVNRLNVIGNNIVAVAQEMMTDIVKWLLWQYREEGIYGDMSFVDIERFINGIRVKLASTVVRNSEAVQAMATMIDLFNVATPDGSLTATAINKGKFANKVRELLKIEEAIVLSEKEIEQNNLALAQAQQEADINRERAELAKELALAQFNNQNNQNGQVG